MKRKQIIVWKKGFTMPSAVMLGIVLFFIAIIITIGLLQLADEQNVGIIGAISSLFTGFANLVLP